MQGLCYKFDRIKGFGFIISEEDPTLPDIFCHSRDIQQTPQWKRRFLLPDMKVEFDLVPDPKDSERFVAKNVKLIPPIVVARQTSGRTTPGSQP